MQIYLFRRFYGSPEDYIYKTVDKNDICSKEWMEKPSTPNVLNSRPYAYQEVGSSLRENEVFGDFPLVDIAICVAV